MQERKLQTPNLPTRLGASLLTTSLGTAVFLGLERLFVGLIDRRWMLAGCVMGAFASTLLFYRHINMWSTKGLRLAAQIVFATFLFIGVANVIGQLVDHKERFGPDAIFSCFSIVFWATVVTSWWLVPAVIIVLHLFNRVIYGDPHQSGE